MHADALAVRSTLRLVSGLVMLTFVDARLREPCRLTSLRNLSGRSRDATHHSDCPRQSVGRGRAKPPQERQRHVRRQSASKTRVNAL
jgi:hypothetical protein